jgi:hypothetical protein
MYRALSTKNCTQTTVGAKPGIGVEKAVTNSMS